MRVSAATAESAVDASVPTAAFWLPYPSVASRADDLALASVAVSAVLAPAWRIVFPAAADTSGPAWHCPYLEERAWLQAAGREHDRMCLAAKDFPPGDSRDAPAKWKRDRDSAWSRPES